jgi:hypothetical protein
VFSNGTKHYKRICSSCGKFNKYASSNEVETGLPKKESKESRILWNSLLTKAVRLCGVEFADELIKEVDEIIEYEKKIRN